MFSRIICSLNLPGFEVRLVWLVYSSLDPLFFNLFKKRVAFSFFHSLEPPPITVTIQLLSRMTLQWHQQLLQHIPLLAGAYHYVADTCVCPVCISVPDPPCPLLLDLLLAPLSTRPTFSLVFYCCYTSRNLSHCPSHILPDSTPSGLWLS